MSVQRRDPQPQDRTNTLAIVSFVSSFVIAIVGIVTGHMALRQIRRTGEGGRGLAIAGLVISYAFVGVIALVAGYVAVVASLGSVASRPAAASPPATAFMDTPSGAPTPPTAAATNGAKIPKPETAAGKTFTGELTLNGGTLGIELDGTKAPQAAAVFKSLTDQNFYNGLSCHRLTTAESFGVLQCGSKAGDGSSDQAYTWGPLENTPPDNSYPAGTIAVARTGGNAYGNGTQFFIVYKNTVIPADAAGGYTVVGKVTSGLDVLTGIAAAGIKPGDSATDGAPVEPVTINSFSLK